MFTGFEPCGTSDDLGGAACAHYLSEDLDRPDGAPRIPCGEMKKQGLLTEPEKKSDMEVSYGDGVIAFPRTPEGMNGVERRVP
ncbi:hypothetical protein CP973_07220 [Streptomyces albofaciens JCM 4342]|uniref:hypothetical protein n=1 Tax=Streptomyces albofaciens TaxID=66866 RepID=UPI00123AB76B|nr:hypothetical protein [Streptomyces albofaciens]KAA6221783.1 hypothetical protein CP973_07220 [Streptomyces albofaciens JCM 4342]